MPQMSMDGEVSAISTTASAHHHGNRDEHSKYDKALVVYSPMAAVIMRARTESMVTGGANELNIGGSGSGTPPLSAEMTYTTATSGRTRVGLPANRGHVVELPSG